jgi:ferritin
MTKLATPVVNLNGSSPNELIRQNTQAGEAIHQAITALTHAAPHGRDYQTHQDPEAFAQAQREHRDRIQALIRVRGELQEIVLDLMEQKDARAARFQAAK